MLLSIRPEDMEFVAMNLGSSEARKFRRKQVRVFGLYIDAVNKDFRSLLHEFVKIGIASGQLDPWVIRRREMEVRWVVLRLRIAGIAYLMNPQMGWKMATAAARQIPTLRFSLASAAA